MNAYGLEVSVKNLPVLDTGFIPMAAFCRDFEKSAQNGKEIAVAVERNQGQTAVRRFKIHGTAEMAKADAIYVDRTVKMLLWAYGGFKVMICGDDDVAAIIKAAYAAGGSREFDSNFMSRVYERPFEVVALPLAETPKAYSLSQSAGRNLDGCRIGFDAGGSDRKVSAVIDGVSVYSEEVVWFPKTNSDPDYHFNGIREAFRTAASKMPRVDAIGVSSAAHLSSNSVSRLKKASWSYSLPSFMQALISSQYICQRGA